MISKYCILFRFFTVKNQIRNIIETLQGHGGKVGPSFRMPGSPGPPKPPGPPVPPRSPGPLVPQDSRDPWDP